MSTREHVILVCDLCSTEGHDVRTRALGLDGKTVELEACDPCIQPVAQLIGVGRRPGRTARLIPV